VDVVIGVDEAGRGPLLGPLVYCAAFWPESENEAISKLGFDDSKALKEGERERLLAGLLKHPSIGFVIEELTAERISEEMLNPIPTSLNQISYNAVVRMLERIRDCGRGEAQCDAAPLPHECFVDTVGDPGLYESKLRQGLGRSFETKFTIEKKADATYKVVSAASIIAKCTRDAVVSSCRWEEESLNSLTPLDTKFGSGYPGDEACVQWLARAEVNAGLKVCC
jgi:ribonuclease H2 subunit A